MMRNVNVVLITIDCLRSDHVSCLGYSERITPNLDALAKDGILFSQAISTGTYTPISFPGILASTYPQYGADGHRWLPKGKPLISEVLKKGGYKTAAFHSAPFLSRYYSYERGFDEFYDSIIFRYTGIGRKLMGKKYELYKRAIMKAKFLLSTFVSSGTAHRNAETINQRATQWLRSNKEGFFLWLHYMDAHFPYSLPKRYLPEYVGELTIKKLMRKMVLKQDKITDAELKTIVDLYDSAIRYVDHEIGTLLGELKKADIYDSTLVIVTADHGEEFREHGKIGHGHSQKPYEELIHVPLIIRAPELQRGIINDQVVSLLDIPPTILDSLNISKELKYEGKSLLPVKPLQGLRGRGGKGNAEGVISESYVPGAKNKIVSYRTSEWKFIMDENSEEYELYNLKMDPKETNSSYEVEMDIAEAMKQKILFHETKVERERIRRKIKKLRIKECKNDTNK